MLNAQFMQYVAEHGKSYGTIEEFEFRLARFMEQNAIIEEHNAKNGSYTLGHNYMSDWTHAEYKRLLGYKAPLNNGEETETHQVDANAVPNAINWVTEGVVSPVKDQGQCGSCWTFSSTGSLEGMWTIKTGQHLLFSEQQLVDCVKLSFGCNGGNQTTAFNYLKNHYAEDEATYPYMAVNQPCAYNEAKATPVKVVSIVEVTQNDANALKSALT